jgi:hypothetical protein
LPVFLIRLPGRFRETTSKDNVESDARLREAAQSANAERRAAMPAMRGGSSVNNDGSGKNNGSETGSTG